MSEKKKKKPSSRLRRNVAIIVLAVLAIVLFFEWRALNGYFQSVQALQKRINEQGRILKVDEIETLLHGSPEIIDDKGPQGRSVFCRWRGAFNRHTIRLHVTLDGGVSRLDKGDFNELIAGIAVSKAKGERPEQASNPEGGAGLPGHGSDIGQRGASAIPDEVSKALKETERLWRVGQFGSDEFNNALQSVADRLPSLEVSTDGSQPKWNTLTINASKTRLDAVRFKSPLDVPADMHWIFTVPQQTGNWYILPAKGRMYGFTEFHIEWNLEIDGIELREKSLGVFQSLLGGAIQPGQEYILWFRPQWNSPVTINAAITLSPEGTSPPGVSPQAIARAMGVNFRVRPFEGHKPPPKDVDKAFRQARLCLEDGKTGEFRKALQSVAAELPEVGVSTETGKTNWNTLALNGNGLHFDVIRFKSPLKVPADMFWALTGRSGTSLQSWNILPVQGNMEGFAEYFVERNQEVEGIELPLDNAVIFQPLTGDTIEPGKEYLIYFTSQGREPYEVQAAIHLSPHRDDRLPRTAGEVAEAMGIVTHDLVTPPQTPGAIILPRQQIPVLTICYTPDGTALASAGSDGTVRLWDTKTNTVQHTWDTEGSPVDRMAVSPDGKLLAVVSQSPPHIIVWDLASREQFAQFPVSAKSVKDFAFSPDGKHLVYSVDFDGKQSESKGAVVLWNTADRRDSKSIPFEDRMPGAFVFSRDSKTLVVALRVTFEQAGPDTFAPTSITFWDLQEDKSVAEINTLLSVADMVVPPDGKRLVAVGMQGNEGMVCCWDAETHMPVVQSAQASQVLSVACSPDAKWIAFSRADGNVRLMDPERNCYSALWYGHHGRVDSVAFSPDGRRVASGGVDATVRLWDMPDPKTGDFPYVVKNSIGMKLVPIPAGRFLMGSPGDKPGPTGVAVEDEKPLHKVTISRPFYMSKYEVTVGQFRQFVEATDHVTLAEESGKGGRHMMLSDNELVWHAELNWRNPGFPQGDDHPVVHVSFRDVSAFCEWLSKKEGKTYRLPTEAEWEYACRAGTQTWWSAYDNAGVMRHFANMADVSFQEQYPGRNFGVSWNDNHPFTSPVGSFLPNPFGLYDIHGNVLEWCSDWYDEKYYGFSEAVDPQGPEGGTLRVQRGGSYFHAARLSYCSFRDRGTPDESASCVGFRVVRSAD